jgi:hypothetical protein
MRGVNNDPEMTEMGGDLNHSFLSFNFESASLYPYWKSLIDRE